MHVVTLQVDTDITTVTADVASELEFKTILQEALAAGLFDLNANLMASPSNQSEACVPCVMVCHARVFFQTCMVGLGSCTRTMRMFSACIAGHGALWYIMTCVAHARKAGSRIAWTRARASRSDGAQRCVGAKRKCNCSSSDGHDVCTFAATDHWSSAVEYTFQVTN